MNAKTYICRRQMLWARRRGLTLVSGPREPGQIAPETRTQTADQNLFQPLSDEVRAEFTSADGGEFNGKGFAPKFHSVHSSAAFAVNVFDHWRSTGDLAPIARALRVPSGGIERVQFEAKLPITSTVNRAIFKKDPNLDVLLRYQSGGATPLVGIECKFTEAYSSQKHKGLRPPYLASEKLWEGLPASRSLAETISPDDEQYPHLHAAQLLKHLLGLKHASGGSKKFRLVYLWYDVPFDEGVKHRQEIQAFAEIMRADGIVFQAITYQEVILNLAKHVSDEHRGYVDYLAERYL